jgi:hypothetical protein
LSDGGQNKLVLGASWATKSKPAELQDALQVRKSHLDLFALAPRLLEALSANEGSGDVASMLMDIALSCCSAVADIGVAVGVIGKTSAARPTQWQNTQQKLKALALEITGA